MLALLHVSMQFVGSYIGLTLSLVAMGHAECINPLGVRLGVEVSFAYITSKLCIDCICNQILDFLNTHQANRLVAFELIAFF